MATSASKNELVPVSMPSDATRSMFLVASGFGIGALVVLAAFMVLIGVGTFGHNSVSPATPAAQSAANAPTSPGPAPKPAPNTAAPAVPNSATPAPETTGKAPAPANANTPRAQTKQQQEAPQSQPQPK